MTQYPNPYDGHNQYIRISLNVIPILQLESKKKQSQPLLSFIISSYHGHEKCPNSSRKLKWVQGNFQIRFMLAELLYEINSVLYDIQMLQFFLPVIHFNYEIQGENWRENASFLFDSQSALALHELLYVASFARILGRNALFPCQRDFASPDPEPC